MHEDPQLASRWSLCPGCSALHALRLGNARAASGTRITVAQTKEGRQVGLVCETLDRAAGEAGSGSR